jgi:hypothetical protein
MGAEEWTTWKSGLLHNAGISGMPRSFTQKDNGKQSKWFNGDCMVMAHATRGNVSHCWWVIVIAFVEFREEGWLGTKTSEKDVSILVSRLVVEEITKNKKNWQKDNVGSIKSRWRWLMKIHYVHIKKKNQQLYYCGHGILDGLSFDWHN